MAQELVMVPTAEFNNLMNHYKESIGESTLMNKAARLAAERHEILNNPKIPASLALSMTRPKSRQLEQLTRKIRTGVSSSTPSKDEDDDMVNAPLENALKQIIKSTKKRPKNLPIAPPRTPKTPKTPRGASQIPTPYWKVDRKPQPGPSTSKGSFTKSLKDGAMKGLRKHFGVSEGEGRYEAKKTRSLSGIEPLPGWEDWHDGKKTRRDLMQEGAFSDTKGKNPRKATLQQPRWKI